MLVRLHFARGLFGVGSRGQGTATCVGVNIVVVLTLNGGALRINAVAHKDVVFKVVGVLVDISEFGAWVQGLALEGLKLE